MKSLEKYRLNEKLPFRPADTHKRACGAVLVIAGCRGMTGAGALASMAALRSGAGLVTWAIPTGLNIIAETLCVEVLTLPVAETAEQTFALSARRELLAAAQKANAVVLGPGMVPNGETGALIRELIPEITVPLVLDAGALRVIGTDWALLRSRRAATVLTPHPGEMSALTGSGTAQIQTAREKISQELAQHTGCVVLLKGANTVVADAAGRIFVNNTGNPGMATAGAGDVLAGVIAALAAAGKEMFTAAALGAHLHGLAGDLAAEDTGIHSLVAGDILQSLPAAFISYGEEEEDND